MNDHEADKGGCLEHYLDLCADEGARSESGKQSCFVTVTELFERLREESSLDELVTGVYVYAEPENSWAPFAILSGDHYFIVLETHSWWWSVELRDGLMVLQRGKDFSSVQNRCRGRYRRCRLLQNGPRLVSQGVCGRRRFNDVLLLVYRQGFFNGGDGGGGVSGHSPVSLALVSFICKECDVRQVSGASLV
ncbi:uncharacterized protein Tco025E_07986 [Trypanosoma conorhini]|uniref:Uncharacterized protein n=1 Tax=Trypanosoma conorhini TaxID=83891 RepID=A0A422NFW0_9TRYP|nr:uncharacterized protein Tco025E_07986 [Trypanosoma conorhini]RNF04355.1 hypothetical protein Tco025E_07986 [Trypanosoma conorhini]